MKWKVFVREYLQFTRRERIAIISLVFLFLLIFFLPRIFLSTNERNNYVTDTSMVSREIFENEKKKYPVKKYKDHEISKAGNKLFYFDPNTIDAAGWKKLGLREKTIKTIENYRNKGGRFRKPADLERIYGLFADEFERLKPYIRIAENKPIVIKEEKTVNTFKPAERKKGYEKVEINSADTSAFIALPGIGSKLAARIINFREKMGGFYSVEQVAETFGLPDSTFQKIKKWLKLDNSAIRKININSATPDELKAHPYIRWNLAKTIIAYREEHGPFKSLEELKNIMAVTEEVFNKLKYYLNTDNTD